MLRDFVTHHATLVYELVGLFAALIAIVLVCAYLLTRFEGSSFGEALYFALITAFTVGFGDLTPKTAMGRAVTVLLAFVGLILIGVFIAISGAALDRAVNP